MEMNSPTPDVVLVCILECIYLTYHGKHNTLDQCSYLILLANSSEPEQKWYFQTLWFFTILVSTTAVFSSYELTTVSTGFEKKYPSIQERQVYAKM